ncbi:hypothetical protein J4H86_23855 [Spiractinospora alimapuensis]|uniref:hypothetical protein n=1 Tax=Spiractinospora alimapuensis TaxID=2820884 RepID=UPI001F3D7C1E|nr:hypothetical protein [Spiractinospora alimapuensis]QVQ51766.1 hypothetical protein J4H86_23855 [Spiractinospora alimapuensis]
MTGACSLLTLGLTATPPLADESDEDDVDAPQEEPIGEMVQVVSHDDRPEEVLGYQDLMIGPDGDIIALAESAVVSHSLDGEVDILAELDRDSDPPINPDEIAVTDDGTIFVAGSEMGGVHTVDADGELTEALTTEDDDSEPLIRITAHGDTVYAYMEDSGLYQLEPDTQEEQIVTAEDWMRHQEDVGLTTDETGTLYLATLNDVYQLENEELSGPIESFDLAQEEEWTEEKQIHIAAIKDTLFVASTLELEVIRENESQRLPFPPRTTSIATDSDEHLYFISAMGDIWRSSIPDSELVIPQTPSTSSDTEAGSSVDDDRILDIAESDRRDIPPTRGSNVPSVGPLHTISFGPGRSRFISVGLSAFQVFPDESATLLTHNANSASASHDTVYVSRQNTIYTLTESRELEYFAQLDDYRTIYDLAAYDDGVLAYAAPPGGDNELVRVDDSGLDAIDLSDGDNKFKPRKPTTSPDGTVYVAGNFQEPLVDGGSFRSSGEAILRVSPEDRVTPIAASASRSEESPEPPTTADEVYFYSVRELELDESGDLYFDNWSTQYVLYDAANAPDIRPFSRRINTTIAGTVVLTIAAVVGVVIVVYRNREE